MSETIMGTIRPIGFTNMCCKGNKNFNLYLFNNGLGDASFFCRCSCGMWVTSGHHSPAEAIMEYEVMCRTYPRPMKWNDANLYATYKAYWDGLWGKDWGAERKKPE